MAKRRAEVNGIRYSTEKSAVPGLNIINVPNNPNKTSTTLIPNHKKPGIRGKSNGKGDSHPPK